MDYILVLDQGTTSSRAIIFNEHSEIVAMSQEEFKQIYPVPGWVEHDPIDILSSIRSVISTVLTRARLKFSDIKSIGITNQRETVVAWSRSTGEPLYNAIVWQCRRTAKRCEELSHQGYEKLIKSKTGLKIDSYFSATKIEWLIKNVKEVKDALISNDLMLGTIDTYLLWSLSGGEIYKTDYTNASRTMLYNIHDLCWDREICDLFGIDPKILPEVCPSSHLYGYTNPEIVGYKFPICGVAGDQQSALFGQLCFTKGSLKVTYGTGCFLLMNTLDEPISSQNGLLTTLSCDTVDKPMYALEGSVFVGGAVVQWLRDELKFFSKSSDCQKIALSVPSSNGVYLVPAFVGLGAPYWNHDAEGLITGITRGTNRAHIVRAALESICYQVNDLICAMAKDLGVEINEIKVDGGAAINDFLMQFQSDLTNSTIIRPSNIEVTALGVCYLAGLASGIWENKDAIIKQIEIDKAFIPQITEEERNSYLAGWEKALRKCITM